MPNKIEAEKVWDIPLRIFHWALVACIFTCWLSMEYRWLWLHQASGLFVLFLLIYRIAWGFIGSSTARFQQFVYPLPQATKYLQRALIAHDDYHPGHNPAGGWMVLLMLGTLAAEVTLGLFANDDIGFSGPLADSVTKETSDLATILHANLFNFLCLLIWFHLLAVFFYVLVKKQNLVKAMIDGKKIKRQAGDISKLFFVSRQRMLLAALLALALPLYLYLKG